MKKNPRKNSAGEGNSILRIAGAVAIVLSAILAIGIVNIVFTGGPGNIWAMAISWALFFGLGIAAGELVINRAKQIQKEWSEKTSELENSRDVYRNISETVPYPLAVINEGGNLVFYNRAFENIFKIEADDIRDIDIVEFIHEEDGEGFHKVVNDCIWNKSNLERTEISIERNNKKRSFEVIAKPIEVKIENMACCEILFRDLTLRQGFIKKIEGLETLSNEIIYQSPIGIMIIDHEGAIESINKASLRIFGLDYEELMDRNIFEDSIPILAQFEIQKAFDNKGPFQELKEVRAGRYLNREIHVSYSVFPVSDGEGELVSVIFMVQDITDLIRARTELDSHRKRLSIIFDNAADGIFISKPSGEITMANPSAVELSGYDIDELIGMNFSDLFTAEGREIAMRQNAWLERKKRVHYESSLLKADGKTVNVDISANKIDSLEGSIILNVVRDVTERKNFINRLSRTQKMESIGGMAKGIALDFNNVLEAITGAAELAKKNCAEDDDTSTYLEVILDSAKRGANLTRHLLNYAGQDLVESELLDMNDIVREASSFLEQSLEKNILLKTDFDPNIGPISGDKSMLLQALINLALNSREAMPEGGEITVSTTRFNANEDFARKHPGIAPGPYVELRVQDTGIGIHEEELPKVFDPFYTTKSDSGCAGLGLPMVYNIAKTHGGSIDIKSVPFGGTEVRLFFPSPIIPDDLEPKILPQRAGDLETKIMVVDDEDVIQTVVEGILKQLGYQVVRAQSGKEALEYLTDNDGAIDLILLDMIMPGLSGWDVFRRLKQFWPDIPVIVVTGYAQEEHLQYMIEEGLEGLIHKPFKASLLSEKIEEVLSEGD